MNPIYNMWDYNYIQQQAQQYHQTQVMQVQDSTRKLKDFLDSLDKIDPSYRNAASVEFCAVLFNYLHIPDREPRLHGVLAPPCRKGAPLFHEQF